MQNRHHFSIKPIMAALFAAGVLLQPAGVQAALVTLDSSYQLTASDPGLITAGKVLIRAGADTEKGVVGLESRGFTMLVDGSFQPLALDVDLQSVPEAVGLLVVRDDGSRLRRPRDLRRAHQP